MIYQWKIPVYSVSAQVAGEELERIKTERGSLTPEAVVDESRSESAPLHGCFEWDDRTAAENYRCQQAAKIIRSIVVTMEPEGDAAPVKVRAFVSVAGEYQDIKTVVETPDYYAEMLKSAIAELTAFRQKYQDLTELSGVFEAIEDLSE